MPRKKLDKIAEATFAFRLGDREKEILENKIKSLRDRLNSLVPDDEYRITKHEIVLTALKKGLASLNLADLPRRRKLDG